MDEIAGRKRLGGEGARVYNSSGHLVMRCSHSDQITAAELWQILRRRRLDLFACVGLGVSLAIILSLILPKRYEGITRLTVNRDSAESFGMGALAQVAGLGDFPDGQKRGLVVVQPATGGDSVHGLHESLQSGRGSRQSPNICGGGRCQVHLRRTGRPRIQYKKSSRRGALAVIKITRNERNVPRV